MSNIDMLVERIKNKEKIEKLNKIKNRIIELSEEYNLISEQLPFDICNHYILIVNQIK